MNVIFLWARDLCVTLSQVGTGHLREPLPWQEALQFHSGARVPGRVGCCTESVWPPRP